MDILFIASEAVPFVKTGGLADVVGSLSKSLKNRRHSCRVVLPLYEDIPDSYKDNMKFITSFQVPLGWRSQYCGLFESSVAGVKFYFIDNEYYFKRRGHYGFFDDAERFAFYSKAVLEMLLNIDFNPQILHCHDWQTALVPVYLNTFYRQIEKFAEIKTVFTIHNIQYQGAFTLSVASDVLGLPDYAISKVEFNGNVNYMKAAIDQADAITTVSPTYAKEILDPWYSHGLDGILRTNQFKLQGILNGLDIQEYNPETDSRIKQNYTSADLSGKSANRRALQGLLEIPQSRKSMVIGMVSRLVGHKGLDLIKEVFDSIMKLDVQLIILGSGDWHYENFLREMVVSHNGKVSVTLGFDNDLAHKIYAGSDLFLMPSKSEPCGLSQMISLRYGTVPLVRETGGLYDSIKNFGEKNGNGFTFQNYDSADMLEAITRAVTDYKDKELWECHVLTALKCDFSWGKSANAFIALYKDLVG